MCVRERERKREKEKNLMALFFPTFFIYVGIAAPTITASVVHRLNWGVVFRRTNSILNGASIYYHTFGFPIPSVPQLALKELNCLNLTNANLINCDAANDLILITGRVLNEKIRALNERIEAVSRVIPSVSEQFDGNRKKREAGRQRRAVVGGENDNEAFCNNIPRVPEQAGDAFRGSFGLATDAQVKTLASNICDLGKASRTITAAITSTREQFSTITKNVDRRLNNLGTLIVEVNERVTDGHRALEHLHGELDDALRRQENILRALYVSNTVLVKLRNKLQTLEAEVDMAEFSVDNYRIGMGQLLTGQLPPSLVSHEDLQAAIALAQQKIRTAVSDALLVETNPAYYFLHGEVTVTRSTVNNYIYAMLAIPIHSRVGGIMNLYRVENVPITFNSTSRARTRAENLPDFIGVSPNGAFYSEFSATEIATCKGHDLLTCESERSLFRSDTPSCAMAIFSDMTQEITRLCNFSIELHPKWTAITRLERDLYYIYSPHADSNPGWQLMCEGKTEANYKPCSGCMQHVRCGCALISQREFEIPARLCDASDKDGVSFVPYPRRYTINLPLLTSLVQDTRAIHYTGGHMFTEEIPTTYNFAQPAQHAFERALERDQEFAVDMKEYIRAVDRESVVFETKAAALLNEAREYTDKIGASINESANELKAMGFLASLTPKTATGAIAVGYGLPIVSIIMLVVVCCVKK